MRSESVSFRVFSSIVIACKRYLCEARICNLWQLSIGVNKRTFPTCKAERYNFIGFEGILS